MTSQHAFHVIDSKGGNGQRYIEAHPDSLWAPKDDLSDNGKRPAQGIHDSRQLFDLPNDVGRPQILEKAGYLLVTGGQCSSSARLTAVASDTTYIGNGWIPVTGMTPGEAKATAVFINSTPGRLQLFLRPAKKLNFPQYNPNVVAGMMIPDLDDQNILAILANAWEQTRHMEVPIFRDGECEVRRIWDHAVADALGIDRGELDRQRKLLHQEPLVTGRTYGDVVFG